MLASGLEAIMNASGLEAIMNTVQRTGSRIIRSKASGPEAIMNTVRTGSYHECMQVDWKRIMNASGLEAIMQA